VSVGGAIHRQRTPSHAHPVVEDLFPMGRNMKPMTSTQAIELTIRTATLIKSVSDLVGVEHSDLARMMFAECVDQFAALGKFIDTCNKASG
jgi:hypothetical protein